MTKIRGEVAICAARMVVMEALQCPLIQAALCEEDEFLKTTDFPVGMVLCVVDLFDCVPAEKAALELTDLERACGNYAARRWAWRTRNLRRLKKPVPVIGHQGFFFLPVGVEKLVRAQL